MKRHKLTVCQYECNAAQCHSFNHSCCCLFSFGNDIDVDSKLKFPRHCHVDRMGDISILRGQRFLTAYRDELC